MGRGRLCAAFGVALFAAVLAGSAGGAGVAKQAVTLAQSGANQQYVPGQVVVGFRSNADPLTRQLVVADQDAKRVDSIPQLDAQVVRVDGSVQDAIASFESNPAVAYAEPNWIYHTDAVPNDPRYSQDYGLPKIQAPQAWDVTTGSAAVTVAIVDTGVASDHTDLAPNMVAGANFVTGGPNTSLDYNGHGTHVAGTIGARGNNGVGVAGVNWTTHLMPLRALNGSGSGTNDDIAAAFASTCTTHPAQIVNASLGGTSPSTTMANAIAGCPNVLFVVAAGNDGLNDDTTPHYPCNYGAPPYNLPNVLCVAATDQNDALASFSNYGASVDLAAPGVDITSTWPAYDTVYSTGFEDPFSGWANSPGSGTFARSTTHATGVYGVTDSPAGSYLPNTNTLYSATAAAANLSGRVGCRASYNLRLDTQQGSDFFYVFGSSNGVNFNGSGWSGSTGGNFQPLSNDLSAYLDGAATAYVGVGLQSNNDGIVGDGGYLDDLALKCLKPSAEDYNTISGTSMATPHVAGVAALVKAAHPTYTVAQIVAAIIGGVDPLASLSGKVSSGGRLNACKAVGGCGSTPLKPPGCVVPNVIGSKLGTASAKIRAKHCRVGKVAYLKSTKKRKGKVILESPKPGKHLRRNAKVNLWLGRGH